MNDTAWALSNSTEPIAMFNLRSPIGRCTFMNVLLWAAATLSFIVAGKLVRVHQTADVARRSAESRAASDALKAQLHEELVRAMGGPAQFLASDPSKTIPETIGDLARASTGSTNVLVRIEGFPQIDVSVELPSTPTPQDLGVAVKTLMSHCADYVHSVRFIVGTNTFLFFDHGSLTSIPDWANASPLQAATLPLWRAYIHNDIGSQVADRELAGLVRAFGSLPQLAPIPPPPAALLLECKTVLTHARTWTDQARVTYRMFFHDETPDVVESPDEDRREFNRFFLTLIQHASAFNIHEETKQGWHGLVPLSPEQWQLAATRIVSEQQQSRKLQMLRLDPEVFQRNDPSVVPWQATLLAATRYFLLLLEWSQNSDPTAPADEVVALALDAYLENVLSPERLDGVVQPSAFVFSVIQSYRRQDAIGLESRR